jgi:hypothetical protein
MKKLDCLRERATCLKTQSRLVPLGEKAAFSFSQGER